MRIMIGLTAIALTSVGLFSCLDAMVGYLVNIQGLPVYETIFVRTSLVLLLSTGYLYKQGTPHAPLGPPAVRSLIWLRGVLTMLGLICGYNSLRYLTLSEFFTITSCLPFPTGLLCWWILGERFTSPQGLCCAFSVIGVVMVTDPFKRRDQAGLPPISRAIEDNISHDLVSKFTGVVLCSLDVLGSAAEMTIMRVVKERASTVQILVVISFCPAVVSGFILGFTPHSVVIPHSIVGWVLLGLLVPCGLGAQFSLTYASQNLPAIHTTICQYSGVIFSTFLQWLVYGNHPGLVSSIGMLVICGSGFCAIVYGSDESDREREPADEESDSGATLLENMDSS